MENDEQPSSFLEKASSFASALSNNYLAFTVGLLLVLLASPYVGVIPYLPILYIILASLFFGALMSQLDRFEVYENHFGIRNSLEMGVYFALPTFYWKYSTKFLGMSSEYIAKMATDIPCTTGVGCVIGAQQNLAFYPMSKMVTLFGGFILVCFLLVQNDRGLLRSISSASRSLVSAISSELANRLFGPESPDSGNGGGGTQISDSYASLFAITCFVLCYVLATSVLDLSASTQVPFLFLGGGVVAGIILLQDNVSEIVNSFGDRSELNALFDTSKRAGTLATLLSVVIFAGLTVNLSMIPIISRDIPSFLSLVTLLTITAWAYILSKEDSKPSVQSHRTAALAFLVIFPFLLYLLVRVVSLQNDGTDPVMLNRWEVRFDFMDKGNTFKINPWPLDAEPNIDSRWVFLKAAIINSARVTLVSIVLCTILGIIVGVARLSSNKLTSWAATVYVEVFRNLPLAVLLFLIATQIGLQFPMFIDEKNLFGGAIYYSNEGIWFATFASTRAFAAAVIFLLLVRAGLRNSDRVEPRQISTPTGLSLSRRPFASLGWRYEPLAADLFVILSFVLLLTRVQVGEALFTTPSGRFSPGVISESTFQALFSPFVSSFADGSNMQTLGDNLRIAIGPVLSLSILIYSLWVNTNVDDDGMNSLEVDDSEEGIRTRFTIWVAAFALALGLALAGGVHDAGEMLSMPEYSKDYNDDGVIDSPGSWDIVEGTGFEITPFFLAMILGLTLFTASVVAEIVRGSIQSLPRGQVEAAISLSLNPFQRLRLVILPQALRSMIPLLNNQYMNVWKNSSLAVVVAYTDIFYVILVMMNNVGKLIPLFLLLLGTYQAGSLAISAVMNWYNSRVTSVKI